MIGYGELIVILAIVLILFGGKKLPEFAKNLGKGIHEFKRALQGEVPEEIHEKVIPLVEKEEIKEKND